MIVSNPRMAHFVDRFPLGYPIYKMVIDDGSSPENSKLVLAARKRKKAKTSSYLISTSADDLRKDSPSYVAKVNFSPPGLSGRSGRTLGLDR